MLRICDFHIDFQFPTKKSLPRDLQMGLAHPWQFLGKCCKVDGSRNPMDGFWGSLQVASRVHECPFAISALLGHWGPPYLSANGFISTFLCDRIINNIENAMDWHKELSLYQLCCKDAIKHMDHIIGSHFIQLQGRKKCRTKEWALIFCSLEIDEIPFFLTR